MKKFFAGILLLSGATAVAQTQHHSTVAPLGAVAQYTINNEAWTGPAMGIQFRPRTSSFPSIEMNFGVVFRMSDVVVTRVPYIPVQRSIPFTQPGTAEYQIRQYVTGVGLGFIGAEAVFYLAEGDVRPYVGVGLNGLLWQYTSRLNGAIAPDLKAGLDIKLSNSVAGFAEVKRIIGLSNGLSYNNSQFDGLTSFSFGVAFAPQ